MNAIQGAKQGSSEAWDRLYRQVSPALIVYLRSKRASDAIESEEDLMSETWVTVAQKIHTFSGGEEQFRAWVFAIAKKKMMNANRKAIRRKTSPTDDFTWYEKEEWEQDWLGLESYLQGLGVNDRELVLLMDVLGFTAQEVAVVQGKTAATVRVAHMRALRRLRTTVEKSGLL